MDQFIQWLNHVFADHTEALKVGASLIVTILGALASIFAKFRTDWVERQREISVKTAETNAQLAAANPKEVVAILSAAMEKMSGSLSATKLSPARETAEHPGTAGSQVARARIVLRLAEAQAFRDGQRKRARSSALASNLLSVAQYVIGGVLASSFVQESLTPKWVGALGVLVLIASLFRQQFHPELDAEVSRKKVGAITGLIRLSEDQLAILDAKTASGQDHTDAMARLMTEITQALNAIEYQDNKPPQKNQT
jgi:hypothetical protein